MLLREPSDGNLNVGRLNDMYLLSPTREDKDHKEALIVDQYRDLWDYRTPHILLTSERSAINSGRE
jgi:hypothetical protein